MADIFSSGSIPVLQQLVSFTESRNRVIADNIANVDTPRYKAKDLPIAEFQAELQRSIEERNAGRLGHLPFQATDRISLSPDGIVRPQTVELPADQAGTLRHDGNNVSIDHEMVKLSANAMMHGMMVQVLAREYAMLNIAVTERIT